MADDDLTQRIADVLAAHDDYGTGDMCDCGWRPELRPGAPSRARWRTHVAEQVRAVLGEATVEWGVRMSDGEHIVEPTEAEAWRDASHPSDPWTVVKREVTAWTEVRP